MAGHAADQYGEHRTILALIVLSTVTVAVLPALEGRVVLAGLVPLLGIRVAIGPLLSAFMVRELPESVQGTGWGLLRTLFFGLGATGSTVIGVFGDAGLFDAGFLLLAALTGITAVFWAAIPRADRA